MVGIVVCCGDVGVVVWSFWFVVVTVADVWWYSVVSELLWDEGGGYSP